MVVLLVSADARNVSRAPVCAALGVMVWNLSTMPVIAGATYVLALTRIRKTRVTIVVTTPPRAPALRVARRAG